MASFIACKMMSLLPNFLTSCLRNGDSTKFFFDKVHIANIPKNKTRSARKRVIHKSFGSNWKPQKTVLRELGRTSFRPTTVTLVDRYFHLNRILMKDTYNTAQPSIQALTKITRFQKQFLYTNKCIQTLTRLICKSYAVIQSKIF